MAASAAEHIGWKGKEMFAEVVGTGTGTQMSGDFGGHSIDRETHTATARPLLIDLAYLQPF